MFALYYNIIPSPGAPAATQFTMHLTPIPEPATALLVTLGILMAVASRRPRR